ncbi:ORF6C domain-containing protein [Gracilibacillus alcaliphilus]|uniref:ORF6C domain-containing protein n=1 Tax=Gracilibacillus alcaliphilus TaxID=1401441 RepID=UPI001957527A|nr:ORF6C domain-containing protein [Gracilibacillus alcaliphilus]MBM7678934.1 prophage antirepressor-like protein [Gracilibacillus alcaliphilus]
MNQLTKMFEGHQLRIIEQNSEPWFVAKDVCSILEIKNSRDAVSRLDNDEKAGVVLTDGSQNRRYQAVNEFGLYNLVLGSRKSEAKKFKRWVTHEVIPSIRKTGAYHQPKILTAKEQLKASMQLSLEHDEKLEKHNERLTYLEDHMRIDGLQEKKLKSKAKTKAMESLGGSKSNAYQSISRKVFSSIWRDFNEHFELPRYSELPRKQFEDGMKFLNMWQPSTSLRIEIQEINRQLQEIL